MKNLSYIAAMADLAESEGVFTTAQAERLGIPRDALHDASESGRVERICRGAYRLVGSGTSETDELVAIWKLTSPSKFTHERAKVSEWDGIAVGGSTATAMQGLGDFYLSPYRIYAPKRINSRNAAVSFGVRSINRRDVSFERGISVTKPERTVLDLITDAEDPSLVADVLQDGVHADGGFDFRRLKYLLSERYPEDKAEHIYRTLLDDSGILRGGEE